MWGLAEHRSVSKLIEGYSRSPSQLNQPFESDAELIVLNNQILAITTDSITEEIEFGLYTDPFLIGWMCIVINLSDLAAVGARPIGILVQESLPSTTSSEFMESLQNGLKEACKTHHTHILGGDTNTSINLNVGGTAIGIIDGDSTIQRKGARPGHLLYISHHLGQGNAYAITKIKGITHEEAPYQPIARIEEGKLIREYGSCCVDTSDGFFTSIATIMDINALGIALSANLDVIVSSTSLETACQLKIPSWFMLAGPHGEYELLFSIPREMNEEFLIKASELNWSPIPIGQFIEKQRLTYLQKAVIDPFEIADLFGKCENDVDKYIYGLTELEKLWKLQD